MASYAINVEETMRDDRHAPSDVSMQSSREDTDG